MMRTFLIITALLLIPGAINAQILGSGTLADPYHGINPRDFTIGGTKYFNADIGVSAGTLTFLAGAKLISVNRNACILISGTGAVNVRGSACFSRHHNCRLRHGRHYRGKHGLLGKPLI